MSACEACKKPVVRKDKSVLMCSQCGSLYHGQCIGGKMLSKTELDMLVASSCSCPKCVTNMRVQRSDSADQTPVKTKSSSVSEALTLESLRDAISELNSVVTGGRKRLEDSLKTCLDKLSENTELMAKQQDIIKNQQDIISELRVDFDELKKSYDRLVDNMDSLEQYGRKNTLEIHGIPTDEANTEDVVLATCRAVGGDLEPDAIDCCHRLRTGKNHQSPGIIVKFVRRVDAHRVLDAKKQVRRLSTRVVGLEGEEEPVFINLSLTAKRRRVLAQAKKLQKDLGFKYVWVDKSENVKIRVVQNGKVTTVCTEKELDCFVAAQK